LKNLKFSPDAFAEKRGEPDSFMGLDQVGRRNKGRNKDMVIIQDQELADLLDAHHNTNNHYLYRLFESKTGLFELILAKVVGTSSDDYHRGDEVWIVWRTDPDKPLQKRQVAKNDDGKYYLYVEGVSVECTYRVSRMTVKEVRIKISVQLYIETPYFATVGSGQEIIEKIEIC
jgi:hypothetical protein